MLDKTKLVQKSLKTTPLERISMKILNDDNAKLAHAGSKCRMPFLAGYFVIISDFALLGPWNTISVNQ